MKLPNRHRTGQEVKSIVQKLKGIFTVQDVYELMPYRKVAHREMFVKGSIMECLSKLSREGICQRNGSKWQRISTHA